MSSKYAAMLTVYFKETLVYRANMALSITLFMLTSLVYVFVWLAVYVFSGVSAIHGITLSSMVVYLFVMGGLSLLVWPSIADILAADIYGGAIVARLIRPIKYINAVFVSQIPYYLLFTTFGVVPILAVIYLLAGLHTGALALLAFAGEVLIAFIITNLIGFTIGSLSIYLTSIYGILDAVVILFTLLGGGIMPITLYPKVIYNALMLTPLPYLYFVPAGTFTGILPVAVLPQVLGVGVLWIAVLAVISSIVWRKTSKDISAVGV